MNVALKPMTVDRYLAWLDEQPRGRFELVDGQVIPMNAQRIEHAETKAAVYMALTVASQSQSHIHVLGDGMAVRIDDATVFEPDALIYVGERLARGTVVVTAPVLVVDVLSPSTKTVDTTRKLEGYFKLASVRHYLIIDPQQRTVIHHARNETGSITTKLAQSGVITLAALGIDLAVTDLLPER